MKNLTSTWFNLRASLVDKETVAKINNQTKQAEIFREVLNLMSELQIEKELQG